ncbi:acetate uptake transporter [Streptomyces sp. HPF1205]|uniref:acetate uptake transporter n=1 Tax=Streptomyces sp. HPF1205 TaxID=2873262 RepID=UPI001CED63AB|nr:acetate uptake transporter [Streptomyces sp. HPF1205]
MTDPQATSSVPPRTSAPTPSIADPGPLGLGAFAMTTFVLSCFNSNIVHNEALESVVLPLALFYGGLAQLLAGMWEFRKNNTFGALAFTSFGSFWLSFAAYVKFVAPKLPADGAHEATGLFLLAWTIFTVYMTVVATRISVVVLAVFTALSLTFLLLTIGALGQHLSVTHAGGWVGLVTAAFAWYGSFAGVANATWKDRSLPTWPLS